MIIRTAKLDLAPTRAAAEAGRDRRAGLRLLTGDAAGAAPAELVADQALTELVAVTGAANEPAAGDIDALAGELPEVLALLTEVIGEDETGIVATAELADRIGWDAKSLGEALRRLDVPSPQPARQRVGGSRHPVSVQDIDGIVAVIRSRAGDG